MDDDWESLAESEIKTTIPKVKKDVNKWAGEDEDDIKDSWEDEEEEEKKDEEKVSKPSQPAKPSKAQQAKIDLAKRQKEAQLEKEEQERLANMTPEERLAEKLRKQQMEKDADLKNALDTFGVSEVPSGLDAFHPTNQQEFSEFSAALVSKISQYKSADEFPKFVEELTRNLCLHLQAADIKKVKISTESLYLEKQKMEKEKVKKPAAKGKSKVKLRLDHDSNMNMNMNDFEGDVGYDDYDDFM